MDLINLIASKREKVGNRKPFQVRAQGKIPAIVYGSGKEPRPVSVDGREFGHVYRKAGESTLVDLVVDSAVPVKVLIQDLQRDVLAGNVTHVDFFEVNMNKEIDTKIKIEIVGDAPAVRELGGTLIQTLEELEVRCLPGILVHELLVDVSGLKAFDDAVYVSDIKVPEGMQVKNDQEEMVAKVEEPRSEDEIAKLNEAVVVDISAVEVEKKGKEETEDGKSLVPEEETKKEQP
ncbi:MAG: 50S ribosomal protein L25 [Patescibacteria group bacterium]